MRFGKLTAVFVILAGALSTAGQTLAPRELLDPLDPRLPSATYELWLRTKNLKKVSTDFQRYRQGFFRNLAIDSLTGELAVSPDRYPLKFANGDFRLGIGFHLSENWLGFKESGDNFSSLQSSIRIDGYAKVKDKIDFHEDIILYRKDNTLNLEQASQTGEFLRDPLIAYPNYWSDPLEGGPLDFDIASDQAVIALDIYGIDMTAGRQRLIQKPGYRNGLLFSGLAQPIDLFYKFDYRFWRVGLSSFAGQLGADGKKYISGKRITFDIAGNLRVGLAEAVSYYDDFSAYINPLMPVFVNQRQRPNNDDNLLAAIDISYFPTQNLQLYAEFLNDDFMYLESKDRGPSKYAFLAGLAQKDCFVDHLDFQIEYCRAAKWTYTHVSRVNAWSHAGRPLGFWLGPDADELFCQLTWIAGSSSLLRLAFDLVRKGQGTLDLPYEVEGGDKTPKFPSGVVEKSTGAWLDLRQVFGDLAVAGRVGMRGVANPDNVTGRKIENLFVHIVVNAEL